MPIASANVGPSTVNVYGRYEAMNGTSSDASQEALLIAEATAYAKDWMSKYDASHDWSHVQRVLNMALRLMREERAATGNAQLYDETVVTLAALLHDVGDRKYIDPWSKVDPRFMVQDFLTKKGATGALPQDVQIIINNVSYSKEVANPASVGRCLEKHPELAVVQDADRLDALGSVGIARCFTYSAVKGDQKDSINDSIAHLESKLLKLEGMMKTQSGRVEAQKRTKVIRDFISQWQAETNLTTG